MGETELAKRAFLGQEHVSDLEHDLYDAVVRLEKQLATVTKRLETVRKQALDEAADVIQDELKRGGRVVDIDNSVNATAMIARIRALKLAAIRAPEEKK